VRKLRRHQRMQLTALVAEAAAVILLRMKCSSLTRSLSEAEDARKQGIMLGMSFAHSHIVAICSLAVLVCCLSS
jgi:hypothetical protein